MIQTFPINISECGWFLNLFTPSRFSKLQLKNEVPLKHYKVPTHLEQLIQTLKMNYSYDQR